MHKRRVILKIPFFPPLNSLLHENVSQTKKKAEIIIVHTQTLDEPPHSPTTSYLSTPTHTYTKNQKGYDN